MGTPGSATPAEPERGKAPDLSHTAPGLPPSEPAQPEPASSEPAPPGPPPSEPAQPEPASSEPVQPEPAQPEPVQPEPVQPEPVQPEPAQPEPDPDASAQGHPPTRYTPGRVRIPEGGRVPEPDQSAGRGDGSGRSELPVARPAKHPPDPIRPFLGKPLPWRRARDWGTLILAMIISAILLAACCAAGFAFYATKGG